MRAFYLDSLIKALKKRFFVPAVAAIASVIWFGLCNVYYDSYWNGTIERVQTVDFNMLHHTLPTTLSYLVLAGDDQSVQKVLDSTYGIFGLVITDPTGKQIVYSTERSYKRKSWQPLLTSQYLAKLDEPFDLLTDPPPQSSQWRHESPRHRKPQSAATKAGGRVIGRLYYVRGVPPSFLEDLVGSLCSSWFDMTGSKRGYVLLSTSVVGFALALNFFVLGRKKWLELREQELLALEDSLATRRRALETLNTDLAAQRQRKQWLEHEAELAYTRALRLKESLEKLKEAFFLDDVLPPQGKESANAKNHSANGQPVSPNGKPLVQAPMSPPSSVIQEVEGLLPDLTQNAKILRSQAEVLQTYCAQLEARQVELQAMLQNRTSEKSEFNRGAENSPLTSATGSKGPRGWHVD